MSDIKTYRAVEQGFHQGRLIQPDATFTVDLDAYRDEHDAEFEPNWAVEVTDGHAPTPDNVGEQEALDAVIDKDAALPKIARPDAPLPDFHPALAVDTANEPAEPAQAEPSEAAKIAVEQANAENGDKSVEVKTTAQLLAEAAAQQQPQSEQTPSPKPRRSRRKPDSNSIDSGTDASDAQKADAEEASKAEKDAADKAEGGEDDGNEFV